MSESSNNSVETVSFRRFLSYIYAYEDDTKLRNVGFAKVEVRPPRVRFQVTVSGILQKGGRPMELCLVDKNLQRVPVGQLMLQNGRGDYRASTGLENMWDSGMSFSQVCGICLQGAGNRHHYYMTLWRETARPVRPVRRSGDNRIIVIPSEKNERMQAAAVETESEAENNMEAEGNGGAEGGQESENKTEAEDKQESENKTEAEDKQESENKTEAEDKQEKENKAEAESDTAERETEEIKENRNEEEKQNRAESENGSGNMENKRNRAGVAAAEIMEGEPDQSGTAEEFQEEIESASELLKQQSSDGILKKADADDGFYSSDSPGTRRSSGRTGRQNIKERNGDKCMELWKRFCTRYPHVDIRPFDLNDRKSGDSFMRMGRVCEVIRIRPNDIGRLPRNNWILAHNSFLQNAYNHYHQLILFRVENPGISSHPENRWFIGLPGENTDQETLVADVFGFKKYLKCRNGGFWYTEIMLG